MKININLKNAREKKGLMQVEVAEKANITERSYQRYEAGERVPNVQTAILIAKALHTTVEKIFPLQNQNTTKKNDKQD